MLYPTELRPREGSEVYSSGGTITAANHFIVGITNCAPSRAEVGQRDVTVLSRV